MAAAAQAWEQSPRCFFSPRAALKIFSFFYYGLPDYTPSALSRSDRGVRLLRVSPRDFPEVAVRASLPSLPLSSSVVDMRAPLSSGAAKPCSVDSVDQAVSSADTCISASFFFLSLRAPQGDCERSFDFERLSELASRRVFLSFSELA